MKYRRFLKQTGVIAGLLMCILPGNGLSYELMNGDLELKGYVRNLTGMRISSPHSSQGTEAQFKAGDIERMMTMLQVESTYKINPDFKLYGRWRGSYDASFDLDKKLFFPQEVKDDQRMQNEFRELFVDIRKGPLFLRLGKQQIVWGEADGLRLADIINPLDLSWHMSYENWEDIRIGLPAIRAIYGVTPKTDLEFVWVPVSSEHNKYGGQYTFWAVPGVGKGGIPSEDPPTSMRNGSVGGKIKTTFGDTTDVSFFDYYHHAEGPALTNDNGALKLTYPYVNSLGATFTSQSDTLSAIFRGEAVYNHNESTVDFTKSNFISLKDSMAFMIGVDRSFNLPINSESSSLSMQYYFKKYLRTDPTTITFFEPKNTVTNDQLISFLISTTYSYLIPNATLSPLIFVFYDTDGSGWFHPNLNLKYGSNFSVSLGGNIHWGHDTQRGNFNPINDRNEAYLDMKYSFQ